MMACNLQIALALLTHTWSDSIERQFIELSKIPFVEAWVLSDSRNPYLNRINETFPRVHTFEADRLLLGPYPTISTGSLKGHGHFSLLDFFQHHRSFRYYWLIEYDVRFTGSWKSILHSLNGYNHDLITTHIRRYSEEPDWYWWSELGFQGRPVKKEYCIRSFNVFYRLSFRALRFLDAELREGWHGHYEALIVTLLHYCQFSLLDLGGDGSFTPPELRGTYYSSTTRTDGSLSDPDTTLRYRPIAEQAGKYQNMLYHPVKENGAPDGFVAFQRPPLNV
jgi:hypothetical protein